MEENESLAPTNTSVDVPESRPNPYNLLMRQSRKMGRLATRTFDVTKEFLKKDVSSIPAPNPDALLFAKQLRPSPSRVKKDKVIKNAVEHSHEILAGIKTVILPVNLFPDSIIVDRTKVTITKRSFFWTSQVITSRIEDILSVTSNFGPIFGSLTIYTRIMNSTDHFEISYFWRKDACYLKEIIQGYVISQHNNIDTGHLSKEDLIDTLLELGRDATI